MVSGLQELQALDSCGLAVGGLGMRDLGEVRREIDDLDAELVRILNLRASLVREVADWKRGNGKKIHDPERERLILDRVAELSGATSGPLSENEIRGIFAMLIQGFRKFESRILSSTEDLITRPQEMDHADHHEE